MMMIFFHLVFSCSYARSPVWITAVFFHRLSMFRFFDSRPRFQWVSSSSSSLFGEERRTRFFLFSSSQNDDRQEIWKILTLTHLKRVYHEGFHSTQTNHVSYSRLKINFRNRICSQGHILKGSHDHHQH